MSANNQGGKAQGKKVNFNEYEETMESGDETAQERVAPSPIPDPNTRKAHISMDIETTASPTTFENEMLEEDRRRSQAWMYDLCWTFFIIIPLFMIVTVGIYWTLTPAPPQQRVVVRLPDNAGIVAVTPARNPWDTPRVVAVYNAPQAKQAKREPTKTKPEEQAKIVKREIPKETKLTQETAAP